MDNVVGCEYGANISQYYTQVACHEHIPSHEEVRLVQAECAIGVGNFYLLAIAFAMLPYTRCSRLR